jgi:hypothetical protein
MSHGHQKRKRKRKPSITTLIRQARKAGERGPISVALPDGTTGILRGCRLPGCNSQGY